MDDASLPAAGAEREALNVQASVGRIEALLAGFDASPTVRADRLRAEELVRTLMALYGSGLERILTIVYDTLGEAGSAAVFDRLCADRAVESLLALHDLHPIPVDERVQRALDSVRPYLKSHEGDIEILEIADGVVHLKLAGSCKGCPSSAATVKLSVEKAILEQVPEIHEVRAVGVAAEPAAMSLRIESDWIDLSSVPQLGERGFAVFELDGMPVLLARLGETLYAYRNQCPTCLRSLAQARLDRSALVCDGCGQSFDLVHAGRADGNERVFIEPFPLVHEAGRIRIALPAVT